MDRVARESKIHVNGVELALWEWPGVEPAVLLCHATSFHARCWEQVIARLPGRHCFAYDARGHGLSSKPAPPYAWRTFGLDTAAVAQSLKLSETVAVGHSMGAYSIALAEALQPGSFSALLLLDPVIRPKEEYAGPSQRAQYVAKRRNRWDSPQEMFERFQGRPPFEAWDPAVLRDYCEYGLLPDGDGLVLACPPEIEASIYENGWAVEADIYRELANIEIPVHVVRAGKYHDPDNVMGTSPTSPGLAASLAHGTDLLLPEYSHFIPMEAPALTAQLILDLLANP